MKKTLAIGTLALASLVGPLAHAQLHITPGQRLGRTLIAVHCAASVATLNNDLAKEFYVVADGAKWKIGMDMNSTASNAISVSAPAFHGKSQVCVTVRAPAEFLGNTGKGKGKYKGK